MEFFFIQGNTMQGKNLPKVTTCVGEEKLVPKESWIYQEKVYWLAVVFEAI
jgi:hypothetical protein